MRIRDGMAVLFLSLTTATSLCVQLTASKPALPTPHPCESDPDYHKLDFWIGTWDVYDNHDDTRNGTDVVTKRLWAHAPSWKTGGKRTALARVKLVLRPENQKAVEAALGNRRRTDQREPAD
jgi:hypothetical protein